MGMGLPRCYFYAVQCLIFLLLKASQCSSFVQTIGHADECSALMQFKQSFTTSKSASLDPFAYPKVASWMQERTRRNCCSWDGVECNEKTGYVIGLNLNSSCLYGSLNSSSSLFQLVHLQKLDLSDNHFNFSKIPSRLGHDLTGLTLLNLSQSSFSGQIPSEISYLSKLSTLDLSATSFLDMTFNYDHFSSSKILELTNANLRSIVQNLTNIQQLHLNKVHILSTLPDIFVNATSLKALYLQSCGLSGEFPVGIFQLPNLEVLDLMYNEDLTGYFPEFNKSSPFKKLNVARTNFSGHIPASIGDLSSLEYLNLALCNFYPHIPSSLGNLTQLSYLSLSFFFDHSYTYYDVSRNSFSGQISESWSWVGKLEDPRRSLEGVNRLTTNFFVQNFLRDCNWVINPEC